VVDNQDGARDETGTRQAQCKNEVRKIAKGEVRLDEGSEAMHIGMRRDDGTIG